ncbi:MAG: NGG1p interacting factor NIF3 [Bacillota bacterium]|jgi:putative NIF3 family GTP cyclohydrolase 1 type 2
MKLQEIYQLAIDLGIKADPRGRSLTEKQMAKSQKEFAKLSEEEKPFFDQDALDNPYADTRILLGEGEREIKKLLVGVDLETPEVNIAATLNAQGAEIDLLLAHHPEGRALCGLDKVMDLQVDYMISEGVRPSLAESLMGERSREVRNSLGRGNTMRAIDAAKLFNFAFMCVHTPTDNLVTTFLIELLKKEKPENLSDLIDLLQSVPEYNYSARNNNPPQIMAGRKSSRVGRFYVDFTGGTSGHKENYTKLADSGVDTVLAMCVNEQQIKLAKEARINLISAGHMASDSIGINLFLDQLEKQGVEVVPISGVIRVKRN